MPAQKLKIHIQTNNNIRFITSVESSQTIKEILPFLLKKYHKVIKDNLSEDQYNVQQYQGNHISQITTNSGYMVPRDQLVGDVLKDNDHLFINIVVKHKEKENGKIIEEKEKSKKEILESKIKEKEILERFREQKASQKKNNEKHQKNQRHDKKQQKSAGSKEKSKKGVQKDDKKQKSNQNPTEKSKIDFNLLMSKAKNLDLIKNQIVKENTQKKSQSKKSNKYQVVQEPSSDSD